MGNGSFTGVIMALDFDELPIYDDIVNEHDNKLSPVWVGALTTLYQTLIGYLTSGGFFPANLTQEQINALINLQDGQLVYNTTLHAYQFYQITPLTQQWRTINYT